MSIKVEIDPDLSQTAVRYCADETGSTPWRWNIVQVDAEGVETTLSTCTIDELRSELTAIQGDKAPAPADTGSRACEPWEQVVERAWLQRIAAAAEKYAKAGKPPTALLRPAEDDRSTMKQHLADLLDATEEYMTWCRD